jgi:hypothetical protein
MKAVYYEKQRPKKDFTTELTAKRCRQRLRITKQGTVTL